VTNSKLIKLFVALAVVIAVVVAILNHQKSIGPETAQEAPMAGEVPDRADTQKPAPEMVLPKPTLNPEAGGLEQMVFSREQVEAWLKLHGRDAASLLAAFRAMKDTNYLNEAATNFPNDPKVQWTVLAQDAFPAERRKWLEAFKQSSPDNSVAFYLSAEDYFKDGKSDDALRELQVASDKLYFDNHENESREDSEGLYAFLGKTKLEAAGLSMADISGDLMSTLNAFKQMGQGLATAQKQALASGNLDAAGDVYDLGTTLTDNLQNGDGGDYLISHLVGIADQSLLLSGLNQNATYEFLDDETPVQAMQELNEQKSVITQLIKSFNGIYASMTPDEMLDYAQQVKDDGELAAMQSALEDHPQDSAN
jgi:hypothetical protein